jgi:acetyl esterase/lipase
MKHVRVLLQRGFLPISVDYRLCPETTLYDGPMTDCCDALQWVRETLPSLILSGPAVTIDTDRVLALGWSSGGQLAMSMGYTATFRGIKPPDAILAFYTPTNLESDRMFLVKWFIYEYCTNRTQTGTNPSTRRRPKSNQQRYGVSWMVFAKHR